MRSSQISAQRDECVAIIGFGSIGQQLVEHLNACSRTGVCAILVRESSLERLRHAYPHLPFFSTVESLLATRPALVVECAGQEALKAYANAILAGGVDLVPASVGAFADNFLLNTLKEVATEGESKIIIPSGAIAGLDGLHAYREAGLEAVHFQSRKPPLAWFGTLAENLVDLSRLTSPVTFFTGNARQAAEQFPKNANVAATIALAGAGFEDTQIELVADPHLASNVGILSARSSVGSLALRIEARPSSNPKTSSSTVFSLASCVANRDDTFALSAAGFIMNLP